ncbi:dTDP-glucose 4,6-dehydratase [Lederbergia galactosidilytica]|uniref:dTDP-glucose 4,6-dehydratase n=1 Tax=Lederbergia galactosidilytica TaxID=217031 RepID=A0A178A2M9_9BACI|nr:dTDP-glucose 4,6-dehydratase [Lederbergia galactosidilytica]OAK74354.1 dTDP-glucose 4,6-dehydratase [Lederbergia galactosidilytica]
MKKELLVTGGAGFIGANFIHYLIKHTDYAVTNVDALTYASHPFMQDVYSDNPHYRFLHCDLTNQEQLEQVFDQTYEAIIHFAAESHVDRSIQSATPFIDTNIKGTLNLLNAVRDGKAKKMIQISTDEVYGSLKETEPSFTEMTPLSPNNPYSASKAGADLLVHSYYNTFDVPVMITRCSNNYGPLQHLEKFIPKVITSALAGNKIPIYGDGGQIRDWLFVEDHCRAIHAVLEKGRIGSVYNIGGDEEQTNLAVVEQIIDYLGADPNLITFVEDRLGHDRRYSINYEKIQTELNWQPQINFAEGLKLTVQWYVEKFKRNKREAK